MVVFVLLMVQGLQGVDGLWVGFCVIPPHLLGCSQLRIQQPLNYGV
jgi:hypothetical protein